MRTSELETSRSAHRKWSEVTAFSRKAIPYALVGGATLVLAAIVLQVWNASPTIPFYYAAGGDLLSTLTFFKLIAETGWFEQSARLGMPFGAEFYGYPTTSGFHEAAIWFLLLVVRNPAVALNAYYFLGFPLSAVSAMYVFRRFGISNGAAAAAAILFSFLPYRFFRNESHLFYASYFLVPLAIMVSLWVAQGEKLFEFSNGSLRRPARLVTRRGWIALAICLCLASDNPYDTFFFVVFLLVATALALVRTWDLKASFTCSGPLIATVAFGFALNLAPTWIYDGTHTGAGLAFHRSPADAQTFSLTLAQLLLPVQQHRLAPLAKLRAIYDGDSPAQAVNENSSASLGSVAAAGFILLGAFLVLRPRLRSPNALLGDLASLNAIAFLLATFGGIGALIAFYLSDTLRSYNRIAPFIALVSLFGLAITFDHVCLRFKRGRRFVIAAALALIVSLGVLDQTNAASVPPYAADATQYAAMQKFIDNVEASVPHGISVFQLPVIFFPEEYLHYARVGDSEELLPFVHSKTLRWSYGSFENSDSGRFALAASSDTPQRLALNLALAGFDGVLIDRNAYDDAAAGLEGELRPFAGRQPIASANGQWVFLNLTDYGSALRNRLGARRSARYRELALHPLATEWRSGCSYPENGPGRVWRWCGHQAVLAFANTAPVRREVHLSMTILTGSRRPYPVSIATAAGSSVVAASVNGTAYVINVSLPPNTTSLVRIDTTAPATVAAGDPRSLVFQIVNYSLKETDGVDELLSSR